MFSNFSIALMLLTSICLFIFVYSLGFAVKPIPAVACFIVLSSITIFYFWLELGLYIALFFNSFDRLTALGPGSPITITKIVIIAVIFALLSRFFFERDPRLIRRLYDNPLTVCAYFFLLFSFISIVNAHNYPNFLGQNIRRANIIILYIIIITLVDTKEKLNRVLKILLCAYFFTALTGLYELFSGHSILEARFGKSSQYALHELTTAGLRVSGPFGDPDFYAVAMVLPTILSSMFFYLSRSKRGKLLTLGLSCYFLLNVVATNSRGGLIAVLIGLATMWWFLKFKWKSMIAIAAIILLLGVAMVYSLLIPSSSLGRYKGETGWKSIQWRIGLWEMSWSAIQKHPILGIGTGNFVSEYNRYVDEKAPHGKRAWPHNSVLQSWAENGFFGMIAYLLLFFFTLRNSYQVFRDDEDRHLSTISVAIFGTTLGLFFFALTSNVIENQDYWILFSFSVVALSCHTGRRD